MGAYVGINSTPAGGYTPVAKKVKKIYVGDEKGIARLVKKAYVGVDGKAKLFWDGSQEEQLVNYLMLYDGSLGEAGENGANVCADVTGGYEINSILMSGYAKGTVTFNSKATEGGELIK